jgi:2-dehydro-3-deoxygluconokinase
MKSGIMMGATAASLVLPSFDEDGALFGDADPQATIARYQTLGPKTVVVKNGAEAITLAEPGGPIEQIGVTPAEEMVDSTAAGDSFAAGLLAARAQGTPLPKAAEQACALAARVIQAPGALVRDVFQ